MSDLKNKAGDTIFTKQITFYRAYYLQLKPKQARQLVYPLGEGWYPDPLVPLTAIGKGAPFAIDGSNFTGGKPAGITNQTVWADLWIPKSQASGVYEGTVTVSSDAGKKELKISLEVFGFEMPAKGHIDFYFETMKYFVQFQPELRANIYKLAHAHRSTMLLSSAADRFTDCKLEHKNGKFNWEEFDKSYGPSISGALYTEGPRAGVPSPAFCLAFSPSIKRPDKTYGGRAWPIPSPTKNDGLEVDFTAAYVKEMTSLLKDAADHFKEAYPETTIAVYQNALDEPAFHKKEKWAMPQLRTYQGFLKLFKGVGADNLRYQLDIGSGFSRNKFYQDV